MTENQTKAIELLADMDTPEVAAIIHAIFSVRPDVKILVGFTSAILDQYQKLTNVDGSGKSN